MKKIGVIILIFALSMLVLTSCSRRSARYNSSSSTEPSKSQASQGSSEKQGPFQAQYVPGLTKPEIVMNNDSDRTITVSIKGGESETITLHAGISKTLSVLSGTYDYSVSAPGVRSLTGQHVFEKES